MDWRLLRKTTSDFNVSVQLLTEIDGELLPSYGQSDLELINVQRQKTSGWAVNEVLTNVRLNLSLSPGATPGRYFLGVIVYDRSSPSGARQPVRPGTGFSLLGPEILLLQEFNVTN